MHQSDDMFVNRLRKMAKHFGKWARRQNIEAFRIYDRDIPGYPISIDKYGEEYYISEHRWKQGYTEDEMELWRGHIIQTIATTLDVTPGLLHYRIRNRQQGTSQYGKLDDTDKYISIRENDLAFLVNLTDYLDTGLFLDHRDTRKMVRNESDGKYVLNLFAYTGSFSVYAIDGGANIVTTVDMSNTYCRWARNNIIHNGFDADRHPVIQSEVWAFIDGEKTESYDLIILDPPTFSNSKRMEYVFDVQEDHPELLESVLRLLSPGGACYFSTNFRKFKPDFSNLQNVKIEDYTARTIPEDFKRKTSHFCYRIEKTE